MALVSFQLILCVCVGVSLTIRYAQGQVPIDPRLEAIKNLSLGEAISATNPSILLFLYPEKESKLPETPSLIRRVLLHFVVLYDVLSACHETALSFLGQKDSLEPPLCTPDERGTQIGIMLYHVLKPEFPVEAESVQLLTSQYNISLKPNFNQSTSRGWAYVHARKLRIFFDNDGWNALGQPPYYDRFADTTGYTPVNSPDVSLQKLRFPLRWQPLTQHVDMRGRYAIQVHTFPHIGLTVSPLALSTSDFESRRVEGPYKVPNSFKKVSGKDKAFVRREIKKSLQHAKTSTFRKRQLSILWDGKLGSLAVFLGYYANKLNFSAHQFMAMGLADTIAQHDALLVAWKEKRRHDLVRPQTLIRYFMHNETAQVYVPATGKVQRVPLSEYRSIFPSQPHSEFPSASALMCTASMESIESKLQKRLGSTKIPPFEFDVGRSFRNPRGLLPTVKVKFQKLSDAAKSCGRSRLWAGVHFEASVKAGYKLAKGIGLAADRHVEDLLAGRVPEVCQRCMQ